ncbi:Fis family transcriptional regulator [Rhizobium sp. RAF56]|jgi:predicted XRE-type DNA-binding protein|uniref:Fis family transcriptional regulator n=1 Tax=Rhizobium sp. RAF56 TaxID=3233062 RepID=UPI003F968BBA
MSEYNIKSPIGSSFESFLEEEGILDEVDELAIKKVIAWQMERNIAERGMSKTEFADAMKTSRTQVNRLLDPVNTSISMHTLCRAAAVFGKSLRIEFVDREERQEVAA